MFSLFMISPTGCQMNTVANTPKSPLPQIYVYIHTYIPTIKTRKPNKNLQAYVQKQVVTWGVLHVEARSF